MRNSLSGRRVAVPSNRVTVRLMALVQDRSNLKQEVLSRYKLVRREVKDGLSVRFRNDDPAASEEGTRFTFCRPPARKETQFVLKDQSRIFTKGVKVAEVAVGHFFHSVDFGSGSNKVQPSRRIGHGLGFV